MQKTIGEYLDNPEDFFWWLHTTRSSFMVLNVTAQSGLLDFADDKTVTISELSDLTSLTEDKLARLVNYLVAEGVLTLNSDGRVGHTARSLTLRSLKANVETSLLGFDAGIPLYKALLADMPSYEYRFGMPVFEHFDENPEIGAVFAGSMAFLTTVIEKFIFTYHTFKPFKLAVDIGGSHGGLLLKLLSQHPEARGILFDRPEITAQFEKAVKSSDVGDRVEIVGGDFFKAVPAGDLYLLKMILHDWNDEECIEILRNIRKTILPNGRVTIIDLILPETPRPNHGNAMDIAMMIWSTGKERKLSEIRGLLEASGFAFDSITENPSGESLIEAVPV